MLLENFKAYLLEVQTVKAMSEKQRRLVFGEYASKIGHGGIKCIAEYYGVDPGTVSRGKKEYENGETYDSSGRLRAPGGGTKKITSVHPEVADAILHIVAESSYGDPNSLRKWYNASTRSIAKRVTEITGINVGHDTVRRYLRVQKYFRNKNAKMEQVGEPDPNRDEQFKFIRAKVDLYVSNRDPVYSNDSMNKVLKGNYCGKGSQIRKAGDPRKTKDHDFGKEKYSLACCYSMTRNHAYFNVTLSSDVPIYAVETQRHALVADLKANPQISKVLFLTDSGGSDGRRSRVYRTLCAALALELGIRIDVCFYPKGTSKWNPIEHRAFSQTAKCCAGQSFTTDDVVIDMLSKVTAYSDVDGIQNLTAQARFDSTIYKTGVRVSDEILASLPIENDCGPNNNLGYLNYIFNHEGKKEPGRYVNLVKEISGIDITDVFDEIKGNGFATHSKKFQDIIYGCTKAKEKIIARAKEKENSKKL